MAEFAITTLYDKPSKSVRAFEDIIRVLYSSLESSSHNVSILRNEFRDGAVNIVFGSHLTDKPSEIPSGSIIFNSEQIDGDIPRKWRDRIISATLAAGNVWDLSSRNLETIKRATSDQVKLGLFKLGHHEKAAVNIEAIGNSLGVVHIGSMTSYRKALFETIRTRIAIINCFTGHYGQDREAIISQSRFVLCTHSQSSRILEWPRLNFLLHSSTPFVTLESSATYKEDYQKGFSCSAPETSGSELLDQLWDDPTALINMTNQNKERFLELKQDFFTEEAFDSIGMHHGYTITQVQSERHNPARNNNEAIDTNWYEAVYPVAYSDPRNINEFHHQEGRRKQLHANKDFYRRFRTPKSINAILAENGSDWEARRSSCAPQRIAACMHFHSANRARYFFACFADSLPRATELYITVTNPALAALAMLLARKHGFGSCKVVEIENRGRDIPSKYIAFTKDLAYVDICLYTHGKESDPHWFHTSNAALCGSTDVVEKILDCFAMDPSLGLLMPDYMPYLRPSIGWGNMRGMIERMLNNYFCSTEQIGLLEFPAGGFFWARPKALALVSELNLDLSTLPIEPLKKDGTLLHAIERMPCISTEAMGYRWEKLELDYTI